jgi:type I restriction enzyme, S subunit
MTFSSDDLQQYPVRLAELPQGWMVSDIAALATNIQPGFPSGKHNQDGQGVPHLRPMNVSRDGSIDLTDLKYVLDQDGPRLNDGDVLFNNTNSPALVGKTAVVRRPSDWAFSNHMTRITPARGVVPSYLAHHLHYLWMTGYLRHRCVNHVNQASISSGPLASVPIAVPPSAEQERIVAAIEEQFSRLDAGVAALERVRQKLKRMRAAVFNALLANKDGRRWPTVRMDSVLEAGRYGTSTKCAYDGEGLPVLRIPNVQSGGLDLEDIKRAIDRRVDLTGSIVEEGDVLIIRTNGSRSLIGRAAVVPAQRQPLSFASYLIQLKFDRGRIHPHYLVAALSAPRMRQQLESLAATSAGQYNISLDKLRSLEIPLPPLADQLRQFIESDSQLSIIADLDLAVDRANRREHQARFSILAAAFCGKLVAQDPNDEPAAVLLERIAAERSSFNGDKATRNRKLRTTRVTVPA